LSWQENGIGQFFQIIIIINNNYNFHAESYIKHDLRRNDTGGNFHDFQGKEIKQRDNFPMTHTWHWPLLDSVSRY